MSALVTGGGGQLARDVAAVLGEVHAPPREELDVADAAAVERAFERIRPALVVNCAAFHNVDECERRPERSFAVNATAVKRLAQLCAASGARLVHLSTNYVFDGRAAAPYAEHDLPAPRSVYAISKLAGEHAALAYAPRALVVRTAGLYGLRGSASKGGSFVTRMLARAREGEPIRMVADQRLSPTWTADLAQAIVAAVDADARGVLHLTSSGACSWYEFTRAILDAAGLDVPLEQVATVRAPGAADRPANGVLARPAADAAGLTPLPHWRAALLAYMERAGALPSPAA